MKPSDERAMDRVDAARHAFEKSRGELFGRTAKDFGDMVTEFIRINAHSTTPKWQIDAIVARHPLAAASSAGKMLISNLRS